MIERKSHKADLDRKRPAYLLLSFVISTGLFFAVILFPSLHLDEMIDEQMMDEVSVDMDMMPALKQDENIVTAKAHEQPNITQKLNKVDEVTTVNEEVTVEQQMKNDLKFVPTEGDELETMTEEEAEPIVPVVTDLYNNELPTRVVEQLPEYPGGMSHFMKWLTRTLRYPDSARQRRVQGTVMVSFVVEKDGSVTNMKLVKVADKELNKEALRVLSMMSKWTPGQNHGKPCRSVVAVPVVFAL